MIGLQPSEHSPYEATNDALLAHLPGQIGRVLDLGCGTGGLGRAIRDRFPESTLIGVTHSPREAESARTVYDEVSECDLNRTDLGDIGRFDVIVCSHVLEHLLSPAELLLQLRSSLVPGGLLLVALPNVLHWRQRWAFCRGYFRYTEGGPLDRTHLRFFDVDSARQLLESAGYRVVRRAFDGNAPLPLVRPLIGELAGRLDGFFVRTWPGLFAAQVILVANHSS